MKTKGVFLIKHLKKENQTKKIKKSIIFSLILKEILKNKRKKEDSQQISPEIYLVQKTLEKTFAKDIKEAEEKIKDIKEIKEGAKNIKEAMEENCKEFLKEKIERKIDLPNKASNVEEAQIKTAKVHPLKENVKSLLQSLNIKNISSDVKLIVEAVKTGIKEGATSLLLRLKSDELGTLVVKFLLRNEENISARFFVETPYAKKMIEEGIPHLKEVFKEAGLNIEDLGVSFSGGGGWRFQKREKEEADVPFSFFLETGRVDIVI